MTDPGSDRGPGPGAGRPVRQLVAPGVAPLGQLTHGASAGPLVCLTGQVAVDGDGRPVFPGDAAAQARVVWDRIEAILAANAMSLANVVKLTTYLVSATARQVVAAERNTRFAGLVLPASTLVVVAGLADPQWLVEIDVWAWNET